jgi:hypothetical protein
MVIHTLFRNLGALFLLAKKLPRQLVLLESLLV